MKLERLVDLQCGKVLQRKKSYKSKPPKDNNVNKLGIKYYNN